MTKLIKVTDRPHIYFSNNDIILLMPKGFAPNIDFEGGGFKNYVVNRLLLSNVHKIHVIIAQNSTKSGGGKEIISLIHDFNETNKRVIFHSSTFLMLELFESIPWTVKMLDDIYNPICFKIADFCYYKISRDNKSETLLLTKDIRYN